MSNPNADRKIRVLALVGGLLFFGVVATAWSVLTPADSPTATTPTASATTAGSPSTTVTASVSPSSSSTETSSNGSTTSSGPGSSQEEGAAPPEAIVNLDADIFLAPTARGSGSGLSSADAADIYRLNELIPGLPPNGVIELVSDAGPYFVTEPITISAGGAPGDPVTIRGPVDGPRPEMRGARAEPYDPLGEPGRPLFRLADGADHLIFSNLFCTGVGNGCFIVVGPIVDLTITEVTASNVRRFFENASGEGQGAATIVGLTISNVEVVGFSKGAIRLAYDTHDVKITDVFGDSMRNDGDNFAIGIHLVDTVHDVVIERVTMDNAQDTLHEYWNGDGFAAEAGVYDLLLIDTSATGNTDAGYDLKANSVQLVNAIASDNKRNYRLSGNSIVLEGCLGTSPNLRGGTGTQAQVQAHEAATVELSGCTFLDSDSDTIVFDVDGTAQLTVTDTRIERSGASLLSTVETGASIELFQLQESTS